MNQYEQERQQLEQRRRLLEAMQQRALGGSQGQMVGRVYVPDIAGSLASLGSAYFAGKGLKDIEGKDQEIEGRRRTELRTELEKFDTNPDDPAAAREALISAHPEMQQIGQILMSRKLSPQKKQELWEVLTQEQKQSLGLPGEDAYQREKTSGEVKKLDNATKVSTTVNMPTPESKYKTTRHEEIAKLGGELEKAAVQSNKILRSIDQMEVLNERGVYEGPTAGVQQFLTGLAKSAGVPVDESKLANSQTYGAELFRNVIDTMAQQGGARGFAKEETQMLLDSFPQLSTSPQARAQILQILRNKALQLQDDYREFRAWEAKAFPDLPVLDAARFMNAPSRAPTPPAGTKPKEETIDGVTVKNWGS